MPQISLARPADLPDILSMIRALSKFHGDEAKVDLATLQDIFFGVAPRATALIARSADQALGYAGLTPTTVLHEGATRLDIHHLYVRETHRGKGIGSALICAARDHAIATGATRLTIGTDPNNALAIAAYRAMPALDEITGAGPRFRVDLSG